MPNPFRVHSRKKITSPPRPIQAQTIPLAMTGRDVVGIAQTGTGKTAAFALPILHRILENRIRPQPKTCRVLVLSPTRELSGQILDSFNAYGRHIRLSSDAGDRRRADGPPGPLADAGRRSPGGDPRPPARSRPEQRAEARPGRVPGARRSRPHARHGLHQRHPQSRRQAADQAPDAVLLGHHAEGHRRTRRSHAARPRPRGGDAGGLDRRAHHPAHHPGRFRGQIAACWRSF